MSRSKMKILFTWTIKFLLVVISAKITKQFDIEHYLDPFDSHPRLLVKNGHLVLLTGRNKDLVFRSSGTGQIKINGNDLLASKIQSLSSGSDSDFTVSRNSPINLFMDRKLSNVEMKINARIEELSQKLNDSLIYQKKMFGLKQFRRIRSLMKRLDRLEKLLNKNECETNPCQNGAICEDGFNQYFCRCQSGFKGSNCEQDVDECVQYQGTELGCQNGGTCLNIFGSFHCLCPPNHQGVRCNIEFNDCRNVSDHEICGQGLCLNIPRTQTNVASFRCVCFQGFTKSNPALDSSPCDVDVNECALGLDHCSRDPPVDCINTRDGYICGPCPTGYSGDGFRCFTTDRCLINNGGCSTSPRVSCFSTSDRVVCGPCPPGYVGDGFTCSMVDGDICSTNNGGCSNDARCITNSAISVLFRQCQCNPGFTGNGIGSQGCQPISAQSCSNNPCRNGGTCFAYHGGQELFCLCPIDFNGRYCENQVDLCVRNPCQNGGQCVNNHGTYHCICTTEFTGRNCEQARSLCGGELDSEVGVLAFPPTNTTPVYANNLTCTWLIKNSELSQKVLNVTFTRFKIERSPGCTFDYLEIFDGPSREYRNLGKFCGDNQLPRGGNIITSFNSLYLHFRSDPSIAHEGFELNWNTIDPACGGLIVNHTNGILESPGYPHHYPANRDCHWEIIADYGKRLQFIFTDLEIEASSNCSFDYLLIREGLSRLNLAANNANLIARFCNWTGSPEQPVPQPITTSGSFARVHFHSDAGIHSRGFHMVFNQIPGVCGGILTGSSGIFQSPSTSYTSTLTGRTFLVYENNIVCDWLIRVMPNERISLRFLSFALEADSMVTRPRNQTGVCMFDYVEVYDGESFQAPLRARLCGRIIPPEIISTGRFLRVKFRSDMSVALRGFIARYQALCGGEFNELEGRIESPNYPAPSLVSKNCTYQINVPVDYIVSLEIEEMDIEWDHRCLFDYLMIQGRRFCGRLVPPPFYSLNNQLKIYYVNDESKPSIGFIARYRAIEIGCGGVLKQGDPMIAISAERLAERPLVVNQCFWEIRANQSYVVMIKFSHSETALTSMHPNNVNRNPHVDDQSSLRMTSFEHQECFDHYLMINDSDGSLIKKFCAEQLPPPITSTESVLYVTYVFNVSHPDSVSLNDSVFEYNSTITTANSSSNIIEFTELPKSSFQPIFKPKQFYATYHFVSSRSFCDKNLFKNTGVIRSPRFPRSYPNSRNCTWIIHVDNGLQIHLNFTQFNLEFPGEINGRCYDYLEIRNGRRPDSPLVGQFCGNGPIPDIVSHSNYLFLRFISDPSMQNKGFELYYEAMTTGCGGTLTAESGSIESPGFPDHYPNNMNCEWKIRVAEGSVIVAYIIKLDIERSDTVSNCEFDYLEVFDGSDETKPSLGLYCNYVTGSIPVITTSKNRMFLRFTTDSSVNHGGFKLNYRTECNRTIIGRYGIIESPNYPNPHPHNLNCNWHILAPLGNNISIAFTHLVLESNIECKFDHVNIFEVNRPQPYNLAQAHLLVLNQLYNLTTKMTLCGNYTGALPPLIRTGRNEIIVQFVSDETRSFESGFRLEWSAEGCGGDIRNRPYGTISSPNYPNPYPMNVECLWYIQAEPGHKIDLLIEDLDLEFSHGCMFDYLQVFSGPDDHSPTLTKLCNRASHIHLSSFGDRMTIKMVSDMSATRHGFNATFRTTERGCGGTYFVEQGSISSPNYGNENHYDPKTDCTYKLIAESNFDVELTIHDYQIPQSPNCSGNYLAIYDGLWDQNESKLLGKFCGQLSSNELKFRSNNSILSVRLVSDGIYSGRGFNITYRKVCGKTIVIDEQEEYHELTSANYPHPLHQEGDCRFVLRASKPENRLTIRFTHFDNLNFPVNKDYSYNPCEFSYAEIYEGTEKLPHKRLQQLCTSIIPQPVVSSGDTLLLVTKLAAFRALVSSVQSFCGGDFHTIEGYISNPGYPNSYPLNIECIWILEAAPGNRFQLEFQDFDIEQSDYCNNDYLEIRLDNSSGLVFGDQRLCGQADGKQKPMPQVQIDLPGNLWIKFRTDDNGVAKGFLLNFRIAHSIMLSAPNGMIGSPGWPDGFYFENRSYIWYIAVPHNHYLKIEFMEFSLHGDQSNNLCPIQLSIFNGLVDFSQISSLNSIDSFLSSQSLNKQISSSFQMPLLPKPKLRLCGMRLPKDFISDSNAVTLMYLNTHSNYYPFIRIRFLLKWSSINATEYTALKQSMGVPTDVNSTFNIFINPGQSFNLLSDNFSSYGNDINWYFRTKQSMHLNITVNRLNFDYFSNCWFNKMTLYTWSQLKKKWVVYKTVCNSLKDPIEVRENNEFRLNLQYSKIQEGIPVKANYNLTIYPICGGNITEQPNGQIDSSEDLDEHVGDKKLCEWMIKVREGRTIRFHIDYYSIGSLMNTACQNRDDSLKIHNGRSIESPLLSRPICGHNTTWFMLPETSTNFAYVVYQGKRASNYFRIRYEEVGMECGGEFVIQRLQDVILLSSPGYPDSPKHDITCEWIVRGPLDYGLQITFEQEKWSLCNLNDSYMEIFNGGSELSGLIEKICVPPYSLNTIFVNSHITLIRYVLKKVDFQSRFNATIMVDSCNREYYVPFGGISDLPFSTRMSDADLYEFPKFSKTSLVSRSSEICTIHLRTQSNFYITLNITSIKLQGKDCSSGDVIEIKDNIQAPMPFMKLCPSKNENKLDKGLEVVSQFNELFIIYKRLNFELTNQDREKKDQVGIKFYATAKYKRCYQLIDVRQFPSGSVFSPNYPKATPRRLTCSWIFYNEPGTRIRLFFNWFNLGESLPDNVVQKEKQIRCNKVMLISRNNFTPRNLVYKYGCSKKKPKFVISLTHIMPLQMYANELDTNEGFSLIYISVRDNESCSDLWNSPHGAFQSNYFDQLNKTGLVGCAWEMKLAMNQSGSLVLDTFDVPGDCSNSTLTTGQLQTSTKIYGTRSVICIPQSRLPQKTLFKYVIPIYREIEESDPTIFLNFNRSKAGFYQGIKGEYFIQNCGGSFDSEIEQEFRSPGYPNDYPDPTFCHWLFRRVNIDYETESLPGYKMEFLEIDLGPDCDKNYFLINPRYEWQGSEKICSNGQDRLPDPIYLTHDVLLSFIYSENLSMASPPSRPNRDYGQRRFRFKIEPVSHGCGGRLISRQGYFQSPNYYNETNKDRTFVKSNHNYPSSTECVWTIRAIPDFHLEFEFVSRFDLEQSDNCQNDFLLFEERIGLPDNYDEWKQLAKLCGHRTPKPIISQSDLVKVTFRSNDKTQGDGFRVQYQQKCGGLFQDDSGVIYSPHYFTQGSYSNELTCVYRIQRKPEEYIQIEFEDFELEQHTNCVFDSINIYLGDHHNDSTQRFGPFCGVLRPPVITSHELLTIVFHSDHFITKRGFKVHYNVTRCGGNLTHAEAIILSPFNTRRDCFWYITIPDKRMSVALRILELDLANEYCRYDCCNYLKIFENLNEDLSRPLAYLCSNLTQDVTFKSSTNHLIIHFQRGFWSNERMARFRLQYWSSPGPASNCGGHFEDKTEGVIVSPDLDEDSYYEQRLSCLWSIIGLTENQIITLEFERFDIASGQEKTSNTTLQDQDQCHYGGDYLQVFDGMSLHSQQLAILCGRAIIPEKLMSTTNSMLIQFVTNQDNRTGHGFRAHFKLENRTCGGSSISFETPTVLTSPGYPREYKSPQQCSWDIGYVSDYHYIPIILKFQDLDLNCDLGDYIQMIQYRSSVYESYLYRPITLCSSPSPVKIMFTTMNRVRLVFKTFTTPVKTAYDNEDANNSSLIVQKKASPRLFRGFNITHHIALCNETLDGSDNGFITNQNYPQQTLIFSSILCFVNISVAEDRQISLFFNQFSFYLCSHSNMTIYKDKQPKILATYCDQATTPNPIFTTTNHMSIVIRARYLPRIPGSPIEPHHKRNQIIYSLSYTSNLKSEPPGCGGNFTSQRGTFTSPNYPLPFASNQMCQWTILNNGYHTITLNFDFFLLAPSCSKHYVAIFDGTEDLEEKRLATFCADEKPAPIHSLSNAMLIQYYSTQENFESGFQVSYKTNGREPTIKGRIITKNTFKFYRDFRVFTDV